ncbi:hypothetical protein DPMN_086529 [Dreissena polymorpha]|uniref:Uncharacterized protein n=1 Tax=Dreissena polymorpha TaxID=45954 RepID=A0A9D4KS19_DREPO|nr:hypothetical protein DPMN_086529 [Dreissena polymorpha]
MRSNVSILIEITLDSSKKAYCNINTFMKTSHSKASNTTDTEANFLTKSFTFL